MSHIRAAGLYLRLLLVLEEVSLQVGLEVQVRDRVLVRHLQQAGQHTIGDDVALVGGVKARVLAHVVGHELRDLRLGALRARRELHERAQVRGQTAGLQEGVLRTAQLPRGLLLSRHVSHILLDTALAAGLLHLLGRGLGGQQRVGDDLLQLVGNAGAHLAQALNNGADRGRGRSRLRRGGRGSDRGRRHRGHNHLRLGRRLAGSLGGLRLRGCRGGNSGSRGGRRSLLGNSLLHGLRGISAHVYNRSRRLCGHF